MGKQKNSRAVKTNPAKIAARIKKQAMAARAMFTDIRFDILERVPEKYRSYALLARLDRPAGIWLLLIPCLWGVVMAAGGITGMGLEQLWYALLFIPGAAVMRAAGCVINDLWDQDLDAQVERTALRPLPRGDISRGRAFAFLAALLAAGLVILLQLPGFAILIGLFSILLVAAYPLMKRITYWPQAFLGLTFNIGALIGWAAVTGIVELPALMLYLAGVFWTLAYDTLYAYQDVEDDARIGIRSTALLFGTRGRLWVGRFYIAMMASLVLAGLAGGALPLYYAGLIGAGYFIRQCIYAPWQPDAGPSAALAAFQGNVRAGWLVLAALCFS